MREYKSPDDYQRPGQRIVNYALHVAKVQYSGKISPLEIWLWNLSDKEFEKVMKWSPEKEIEK